MTRIFPGLKEEYYLIRRRKQPPRSLDAFKKTFKYRFTELAPNAVSRHLSRSWMHSRLREMGFAGYRLALVDHHKAHAAAAAFCCGFPECLVITLDGVGDGCCGSLWSFRNETLSLVKALPASRSLGIFFEHVTNLMNMRELEDEGKVMALANYAYPIADDENPLLSVIKTKDLDIVTPYSSTAMFREMKKIIWNYPSEQFAAMAQRVLEKCVLALATAALAKTGHKRIAAAGGVFSNIKMNMKLAAQREVENIYVFPHMGDGGLAIGAAMLMNHDRYGISRYSLRSLALGPSFTAEEVWTALQNHPGTNTHAEAWAQRNTKIPPYPPLEKGGGGDFHINTTAGEDRAKEKTAAAEAAPETHQNGDLLFRRIDSAPETAARLILDGEIILWFQGRMEIGPRSLGNRSILARPDDSAIKDRLNILLKKRVWYQPFCPSILVEDAPALLHTDGQNLGDNPFMTMAFRVRDEQMKAMAGVINIDGTCRPQFVGDGYPLYRDLLRQIKKILGYGVLLNTSFNIHGEPVVCTPPEAVDMLQRTGIRYLVIEDVLVENMKAQQ
jgi:carbamoyltransferase